MIQSTAPASAWLDPDRARAIREATHERFPEELEYLQRAVDGHEILLVRLHGTSEAFLVTLLFNVPRNEALALVDSTGPDADSAWERYALEWTRWNHVRTLAAFAASVYLTIAVGQLCDAAP